MKKLLTAWLLVVLALTQQAAQAQIYIPGPSTASGTVSSVAMTGDNVVYQTVVGGSPVTTSGTLVPALKLQSANTVFGNFTSGSAAPTFANSATMRTSLGVAASGANSDITSLSALSTPLSVTQGGSGSAIGGGLYGAYGSAADTSGTVSLTTTTPRLRLFSNGSSTLTYNLPDASDCGANAIIWFKHTGSSSTGDVTLDPASGDGVGTLAIDANYVISATLSGAVTWALISDGVDRWSFIVLPNALSNATNGLVAMRQDGLLQWSTAAGTSLGSATSLVTVGALTSGSIASGFGSILTLNPIQGTALTASSGDITATNGNLALNTAGNGINIKVGSNARAGQATLSSGSVVVNTTAIATGDYVFITRVSGTTANFGNLTYTISNATSFTVTSTNVLDDGVFNWIIVRPTSLPKRNIYALKHPAPPRIRRLAA